jgi:hypothetical protein
MSPSAVVSRLVRPSKFRPNFIGWSEMMKANDMLLWTVLGNRVRILPKIGKSHAQIEEFHLTAAEPHLA